jgi:hypothetical protein
MQEIFLYSASRPALGPDQPPKQWIPGVLSSGVKRPGCEANYSPPSIAEVKNGGVIPPLPIRLHRMVLKLSPGITILTLL